MTMITMQYIETRFSISDSDKRELLVALLSEMGFEGFEETDNALLAYIPEDKFDNDQLTQIAGQQELTYTTNTIQQQNWNKQWEENFQPVIVTGFCTVRADFHDIQVDTPYEIIITPKMSFGTGHHATTQLMITEMGLIDFKQKEVLDFGTGTGILAILAEMLGATDVLAIDNDEWSYENARENIERNNCSKAGILQGSLEITEGDKFDIILANINRHILLQYMADMKELLKDQGLLLMSGLLLQDKDIILAAAAGQGFTLVKENELNNWIVLLFVKE